MRDDSLLVFAVFITNYNWLCGDSWICSSPDLFTFNSIRIKLRTDDSTLKNEMYNTVFTYDFSLFEKFQFENSWEPHLDQSLF